MTISNIQNTTEIINALNISNSQLDSILDKHPYFQLGLMEKSRLLKQENHIDSLKVTRKCAILFPDRSLLYNYLNEKDNIGEPSKQMEAEEVEIEELKIERPVVELDVITIEKEEKREDNSTIKIEKEIAIDDELEKEFLIEAINQSIQKDASLYILEDSINKEVEIRNEPEQNKVLSFAEWIDDSTSPDESLGKIELIDKFIQENPQIKRLNDQSFYSPIEKGKESISDESLMYTETLADIFVQQGNKSHAIKAYQYLLLKNPQKSVYFADLIKKLEEK